MSAEETSAPGPVYRVHWVPGTDELRATCHCGAVRLFDDPIELWTWLLDHPTGHEPAVDVPVPAGAPGRADRPTLTGASR